MCSEFSKLTERECECWQSEVAKFGICSQKVVLNESSCLVISQGFVGCALTNTKTAKQKRVFDPKIISFWLVVAYIFKYV